MDRIFIVLEGQERRRRAHELIESAPDGWILTAEEPGRTVEQNAAQWPILEQFAKQKTWIVNGIPVRMTSEEWKDVLSAAFEHETVRMALGVNGGVVALGVRTSKFGKKKFSDWLEFLHAQAAAFGINLET